MERRGLAHWANGSQFWGEIWADNDGGYTTAAQVYVQLTNTFESPGLFYNGTNYTNEGGWAAAHAGQIKWILGGNIPIEGHYLPGGDGDIRNGAFTNIAAGYGFTGFDVYHVLDDYYGWSNDIATGANLRLSIDGEHPGAPGALHMAVVANQATLDTNINTTIIDWTAAAVALTNHCVVTGVSLSGGALSFTWLADRHSMAFDIPDGTITNNAGNAFVMQPALSNAFFEVIRFTNVPPGMSFSISEDGSNILSATSAQLTGGINFFAITKGAMWAQRKEVLGCIRDKRGVDRNTLAAISPNVGEIEWSDTASQFYWDNGARGDTLISDMAPYISLLNSNDARIWAAAMPTNHVFTFKVVGQTIAFPSPGDQIYGVAPVTLDATASSGLPVTFSVSSGPALVSSNLLTITNVGQITIQASQPGDSNTPPAVPVSQTINVAPKTLHVSLVASDKTYDGTPVATIIDAGLIGIVGTDDVTLATGPATFSDKNVGTEKTVTVTDLGLGGLDAGKYTLDSTSATTTASILPASLTVSGVTAADKIYDGDTTAIVSANGAALVGVIDPDVVTLSGTAIGTFADANVGAAKPVTISGLTLDGADAGNYQLTEPTATANITAASTLISVTPSANPSATSSNITFTATVTALPPGGGIATGNVVFRDGATALATNILNGTTATFSTTNLSYGFHAISAEYVGDGNFLGSTGNLSQVVDSAPDSNPMIVERYAAGGVLIRSTDLLTNTFDPDGDTLSLISVDATSEFGGTVSIQGDWICYQPAQGFTNSDGFSYVVADGLGLQTTGLVAIAVQVDVSAAQNISRVVSGTNNLVTVRFFGIPQRVYRVQYATDPDSLDWQTIGTATANDTGVIQFFDSPPTNSPPRTYRTTYP